MESRWSGKAEAVPMEWKEMVNRCIGRDPNRRPRMNALEAFWYEAWQNSQGDMIEPDLLETARD